MRLLCCVAALGLLFSWPALADPPAGQGGLSNYPCSNFSECKECGEKVEGVATADQGKNRMTFLAKCEIACGTKCATVSEDDEIIE